MAAEEMDVGLSAALEFQLALSEGRGDAICAVDRGLVVVHWNSLIESVSGRRRPEALGRSVIALFPQLEGTPEAEALRAAIGGCATVRPRAFFAAHGTPHAGSYDAHFAPLFDEGGVVRGALVVARHRGGHAEAVARLTESEARFRVMADCAPVMLWMAGPDARCEFFNQTWLDFTGRTMEQELGYGWAEGVHPEDLQGCLDTYMDHFRRRVGFEMVYRLARRDGAMRWILDRALPRFGLDGVFAGFIGSCVDISDRVEGERALEREVRRTQRAHRELEVYAVAAAHDLRTPVRGIETVVDWLAESLGPHDSERARFIEQLRRRVGRLDYLLDAMIAYSAAGEIGDDGVGAGARELLEGVAARSVREGQSIRVEAPDAIPEERGKLAEVVRQLVDNALRHHDRGDARVVVRAERVDGALQLTVTDDGPGVPPELQARVFQPFKTLRPRDEQEGAGIGLSIAKKLVEMVGGALDLESPIDGARGSRFSFAWPLCADDAANAEA